MRHWLPAPKKTAPTPLELGPGSRAFYPLVLTGLLLGYSFALGVTYGEGLLAALFDGVINIAAIALLGWGTRAMLLRFIFGRPAVAQLLLHLLLAITYVFLLYWLLLILVTAASARHIIGFTVQPFHPGVAIWMLLQGMTIYVGIALAAYAEQLVGRLRSAAVARQDTRMGEPVSASVQETRDLRLFVRQDDDVRPLDPARIILARGADDYAEIVTDAGAHLVRMTLAQLGERLGPRFIRAHRSCLVNTDRIARVEPAGGGRMLMHLDTGELITASRAGSRLLRERIV